MEFKLWLLENIGIIMIFFLMFILFLERTVFTRRLLYLIRKNNSKKYLDILLIKDSDSFYPIYKFGSLMSFVWSRENVNNKTFSKVIIWIRFLEIFILISVVSFVVMGFMFS